jgi:hypothetical protein
MKKNKNLHISRLITESLTPYHHGRRWHKLIVDLRVEIRFGYSGVLEVFAPIGFETDFASIPRAFLSLFNNDGPWAEAAIIHDFLYTVDGQCNRNTADSIMFLIMYNSGINFFICCTFWLFVRLFGWISFNKR